MNRKTDDESRPMITPKLLKEFRHDQEIVKRGLATAMLGLKAEHEFLSAQETIRRTRQARLEVGAALRRIHTSRSFLDEFASWDAFLKSVKIVRVTAYQLMEHSDIFNSCRPTLQISQRAERENCARETQARRRPLWSDSQRDKTKPKTSPLWRLTKANPRSSPQDEMPRQPKPKAPWHG